MNTASAPRRLPRRARRAVLLLHVIFSAGWLGLDLGLLALGIAALASGDPALVHGAYLAMELLGDTLLVPIGLLALLTGLALALGTVWGLFRHYWVAVKFVLTVVALTASTFALRSGLHEAAAAVRTGEPVPGGVAADLVVGPSVALTLYVVMTGLSILKPWGRTRWGRRVPVRTP
ncbi:DUF2269 domain-containing protein [Actinomadura craniellae]|uniref:DUF2269 domain-containing protein n=1 Tax=Actinomadura craniellae TaxID=2231787 RepID=A0A365HC47_9ACTN|nr:DUF2269 domain-containing protein [Actinomadura craniellae]RAY16704.1 DUF2269 domain-containing protein [Actinomadura craniellae]